MKAEQAISGIRHLSDFAVPSTGKRVRCRDVVTAAGGRVDHVRAHCRLCCARGRGRNGLGFAAFRLARVNIRADLGADCRVGFSIGAAGEGRAQLLARVCGSRGLQTAGAARIGEHRLHRVARVVCVPIRTR